MDVSSSSRTCIKKATIVLSMALAVGIFGYHFIAGLEWVESFLNASMILTGMGPVDTLHTTAAKMFAGCYALFSGIVFITVVSMTIGPVMYRVLHPQDRT